MERATDITAIAARLAASVIAVCAAAAILVPSARASTGPDAVVLVSGITTTTPFTTPTAQCSGRDPRGATFSYDGAQIAAAGYRVYTAPVRYGAGPVTPQPPLFSACPPQLPASMTINSRGDIYANARALASFIAYLHAHDGVRTIRIVAHSYGGLWSRGALRLAAQTFPEVTVESLTTLGTPHLGSFLADIAEGIDPAACGDDLTCKVLVYLAIALRDAKFEPALSEVTAASMAGWNPGHGSSLNAIPVSAIAGDAITLPEISNAYVSPDDVLVGLRSAQAAGLGQPGIIPRLSCFAPVPDVHSNTFLPFFPRVAHSLVNDPAVAADVVQTLGGTPAPEPCPGAVRAAAAHGASVAVPLRTAFSARGGTLPAFAADDVIIVRSGTTLTCRGRALPSIPFLDSPRLRILPQPVCRGRAALPHGSAAVLYIRGSGATITLQRTPHGLTVRTHGVPPTAKIAFAVKRGSRFIPQRLRGGSFAVGGPARAITCRVIVTPRQGRPAIAVATVHAG